MTHQFARSCDAFVTFSLHMHAYVERMKNQLDPIRALESITNELETLREFSGVHAPVGLVELHGALLLFALEGRAELIPPVRFPMGSHRILQSRVVAAARRLAGPTTGEAAALEAMERASQRIEQLLHLIDPELVTYAA
jgi:hypothetical protein